MVELFRAMGTLNTADADLLALYCDAYAAYRAALANVAKTGQVLVVQAGDGSVEARRSPFSVELHKYADRCARLLAEMKLTPACTASLTGAEEAPRAERKLIYRFGHDRG